MGAATLRRTVLVLAQGPVTGFVLMLTSVFHTRTHNKCACATFWTSLTVLLIMMVVYGSSFWMSFAICRSRLGSAVPPIRDLANSSPAYSVVLFIDQGFFGRTCSPRMHFGAHIRRAGTFYPRLSLGFHFFPSVTYYGAKAPSGFAAPLWMLAVPFAALALAFRHCRRTHRTGYCIRCGYDLYGSRNGTCPECGAGNYDVMLRAREKDTVLACPHCRSIVAPETDLTCVVCGTALDAVELRHDAFHRDAPIRPFMSGGRPQSIHRLCLFPQCLRPRAFWAQLVVDPPLRAQPLLTFWLVCTLGIISVLSVLLWSVSDMVSVGSLVRYILGGIVLPPMCCLSVLMFRNPRERGHVSGTNVMLCYAYSMPVFGIALVSGFVINVMSQSGLELVIGGALGIILPLCVWTYAVTIAFACYPPVRSMLGVMVATQVIVPMTTIILLFGTVVALNW
jgi:hypothetical protein